MARPHLSNYSLSLALQAVAANARMPFARCSSRRGDAPEKKKHTRAPAKPPRAFFIGLHSVTSRSPYYLYCLHARSLCNLTEKGSRAFFAFIIFSRTRESPSFRPHPVRRRGDARKRQPSYTISMDCRPPSALSHFIRLQCVPGAGAYTGCARAR